MSRSSFRPASLLSLLLASSFLLSACGDDFPEPSGDDQNTPNKPSPEDPNKEDPDGKDPDGKKPGEKEPGEKEPEEEDEEPAEPLTVTLLHINDHHSHLRPSTLSYDASSLGLSAVKNENNDPVDTVDITYGGFPYLSTLFQELESSVPNPIKVHAGDAITGTLFYSLFKGEADASLMNHICFDYFALGNHEFDDGDAGLAFFLDHLKKGDCGTEVLAANVVPHAASPVAKGYFKPYSVRKVEGQSVGFIGIDIAGKTKNSSKPDKETQFLDELETAQKYIDELQEKGVNKIVLITHYQYENDQRLAQALRGVDVIVGGDSHTLLGSDHLKNLGFTPGGEYPTRTTNQDGDPVCIVQAWEYSHILGQLQVEFDKDGKVSSCDGLPFVPMSQDFAYTYQLPGDKKETRTLSSADASKLQDVLKAIPEVRFVAADAKTNALLAQYSDKMSELEKEVIGQVGENLCIARIPGDTRSALCQPADLAKHGSDISNIIAKAFLSITPTADISIQNGGGVRIELPQGDLSFAKAVEVLPFTNTLVTLELTGAQIRNVLEDALENALKPDGSTGSYPYASGLRYVVDSTKTKGSRVSQLEINPRVSEAWEPIDLTKTYIVVTNDFIASGQDGYTSFGTVYNAGKFVNTYTLYTDGFINYVRNLGGPLQKLPVEEYSTQDFLK